MHRFAALNIFPLIQQASIICFGLMFFQTPLDAQLLLHGGPAQESHAPAQGVSGLNKGPQKLKPVMVNSPSEETILGHELTRAGAKGLIAFARVPDQSLQITKLVMEGEENAPPFNECRVDVNASTSLSVRALGRNAGLAHYEVDLEACPFSFDVMNGAILVAHEGPQCNFKAANCLIDPSGLWGPGGSSFSDKQIKAMEHARALAEANMRTNYRALQSRAGKDRSEIKRNASEQAGFSSEREVVCRNYDREEVHGFCGLQITQSRVLALQTEYNERALAPGDEKPAKSVRRANHPSPRKKLEPAFPAANY